MSHITRNTFATCATIAALAGGASGAITSLVTVPTSGFAARLNCPSSAASTPPSDAATLDRARWCTYVYAVRSRENASAFDTRLTALQAEVDKLSGRMSSIRGRAITIGGALDNTIARQDAMQKKLDGMSNILDMVAKLQFTSSGRTIGNIVSNIAARLGIRGF